MRGGLAGPVAWLLLAAHATGCRDVAVDDGGSGDVFTVGAPEAQAGASGASGTGPSVGAGGAAPSAGAASGPAAGGIVSGTAGAEGAAPPPDFGASIDQETPGESPIAE